MATIGTTGTARTHPYETHLPLTRIAATSGPVTLRLPDERELARYCDQLADGALDDDQTRATLKWQPDSPASAAIQTLSHVTEAITREPGPDWLLPLFVFVEGEPIGRQDISSDRDFAHLGHVQTASVLLTRHRRRGYGTHARACALSIAWELGATRALTAWRADNEASAKVSAKLGYVANGTAWWWDPRGEQTVEVHRAWVDPSRFRTAWRRAPDVTGIDDDARRWIEGP